MKRLTRLLIAGATACLIATPIAFAHETHKDEGPITSASYDFDDFTRINVTGVYAVEVEVGEAYSIELSGPEKRMDEVEIRRRGGTLFLEVDQKRRKRWRGHNSGVDAVITVPQLDEISLTGVGSVEVDGIDSDDFTTELEGVGSIELSGICRNLKAQVSGVGSIEAYDLECKSVDVSVDGMGSAEVYASQSVNADIDGMGSVDVKGSPKDVKKSKSLMSSISIR